MRRIAPLRPLLPAAVAAAVAVAVPEAVVAQSGRGTAAVSPSARAAFVAPAWAFPVTLPTPPDPYPSADSTHRHQVPGSALRFTQQQAYDRHAPVDWFPASHPAPPSIVMHGRRPDIWACGFCHLPDGAGRPENAMLAGLPEAYIVAQVRAFRDGTRLSANPAVNTTSMHRLAKLYTDDEVAQAAAYFARLVPARRNRIVESDSLPRHRIAGLLYARDGSGRVANRGQLIEMPEDLGRHELHDPSVPYVTYVPRGSIARGRRLATEGPTGVATACVTCHGPDLLGVGVIPPIAGRSPQYLLRQLISIRTGARADAGALPMQAVVAGLSLDDMVAVAAYVGSLAPARGRATP